MNIFHQNKLSLRFNKRSSTHFLTRLTLPKCWASKHFNLDNEKLKVFIFTISYGVEAGEAAKRLELFWLRGAIIINATFALSYRLNNGKRTREGFH